MATRPSASGILAEGCNKIITRRNDDQEFTYKLFYLYNVSVCYRQASQCLAVNNVEAGSMLLGVILFFIAPSTITLGNRLIHHLN